MENAPTGSRGERRTRFGPVADAPTVPDRPDRDPSFPSGDDSNVGSGVWTIVLAAGSGSRFGAAKQFLELAGREVLGWSVSTAEKVSDGVVIVVPEADLQRVRESYPHSVVAGGATRVASAAAGVAAVPDTAQVILVHDAARPFASEDLFRAVVEAVVGGAKAVVPAVEVTDTIRTVDGAVLEREALRAIQTPQGFDAAVLRDAHRALHLAGDVAVTDDASYVQANGVALSMVDGEVTNMKITNPNDLAVALVIMGDTLGHHDLSSSEPS